MTEKVTTLGRLEKTLDEKKRDREFGQFMASTGFEGRGVSKDYKKLAVLIERLASAQDDLRSVLDGLSADQRGPVESGIGLIDDAKKDVEELMKKLPTYEQDSEKMKEITDKSEKEGRAGNRNPFG